MRGLAPVEKGRKASLEKGEQTEKAIHPVDGSPERLCGPAVGADPDREFLFAPLKRCALKL